MNETSKTIAGDRKTGIALVLSAAFFWSFSGISVKSMPGISPLLITGYRSIFTLLVMLGYFIFASGGTARAFENTRHAMSLKRAWGSAVCYALMLVMFISATRYTTAANAILLQYSAPLYVALLSVPMLGEKVRPREWLTLFGCLIGIMLFFGEKLSAEGWWGNVLALLSGGACALNTIYMRSLAKVPARLTAAPESPKKYVSLAFPAIILGNLLTIVICLPWMLDTTQISVNYWGILVFMGCIQLGFAYILFTLGLSKLGAIEGMILAMTEAVLNPLWVAAFVGEFPSKTACVGGALILVSIAAYSMIRNERTDQNTDPATQFATVPGEICVSLIEAEKNKGYNITR